MNYELKTASGTKIIITEEEKSLVLQAMNNSQKFINLSRIPAVIMVNAITDILPEELTETNERTLKDGRIAIKRFGKWVLQQNPSIELDLAYHPELLGSGKTSSGMTTIHNELQSYGE